MKASIRAPRRILIIQPYYQTQRSLWGQVCSMDVLPVDPEIDAGLTPNQRILMPFSGICGEGRKLVLDELGAGPPKKAPQRTDEC